MTAGHLGHHGAGMTAGYIGGMSAGHLGHHGAGMTAGGHLGHHGAGGTPVSGLHGHPLGLNAGLNGHQLGGGVAPISAHHLQRPLIGTKPITNRK